MDVAERARRSAGVAAVFDQVADTYDAVGVAWFTPIATRLIAELAPTPGERALDVGTGRGAALWPLAEQVGPSGHVTGIDLSPAMVQATLADAEALGLLGRVDPSRVDLRVADAASPGIPSQSIDVLAASLVLFFLPAPVLALEAWFNTLRPGGRIGVTTFGPRDDVWENIDAKFARYLPQQMLDARTSGASGPFASDGGVEALVEAAGFSDIHTSSYELPVRFTDVDHWRRWSWSHGQRTHWLAVPSDSRADVLQNIEATIAPILERDGGFTLTQTIRQTFARRG